MISQDLPVLHERVVPFDLLGKKKRRRRPLSPQNACDFPSEDELWKRWKGLEDNEGGRKSN